MAFVHDIEADRIDDFNLFQAFVRVPLLILGGVLGGSNKVARSSCSDIESEEEAVTTHWMTNDNDDKMDCSSSTSLESGDVNTSPQHLNTTYASPSSRIVSYNDIDEKDTERLKRAKKMSWSDSLGLSLVEYYDESSTHEPLQCLHQPVRSAMKKFRPEHDPAANNLPSSRRFIPKMGGGTLNMPSFTSNGGSPALSNGYVSPEWGWYINTTPPTPEMYHSSSTFSASKLSRIDHTGAPKLLPSSTFQNLPSNNFSNIVASEESGRVRSRQHQNQVFQNLQSTVTPSMGWTSVPI